jgi:hypothetical protein
MVSLVAVSRMLKSAKVNFFAINIVSTSSYHMVLLYSNNGKAQVS